MTSLLPRRQPVDHTPEYETEVSLVRDRDDSADVLQALTSETARDILTTLQTEPKTTSDVAEAIDTSLQNARYHLTNLREAGLVEAVDTWYSERGSPMTVYAVTSQRLVIQFGPDDHVPSHEMKAD